MSLVESRLVLAALAEVPALLAEVRPLLTSDAAAVSVEPYVRELARLEAQIAAAEGADAAALRSESEDAALRLELAIERERLIRSWGKIEARAKVAGAVVDAVARLAPKLLALV